MSDDKPLRVYADTNIFLAFLQKEEGRYHDCRHVFERAKKREIWLFTSIVTLTETAGLVANSSQVQDQDIEDFFKYPWVRVRYLDRSIATEARRLVQSLHNLKPLDAIHLATAKAVEAQYLYTYDHKDLIRRDKHFPDFTIQEPPPTPELPLDMPLIG